MFKFAVGERFRGPEVDLVIRRLAPAAPAKEWAAAYHFDIVLTGTVQRVGQIDARVGYTNVLVKYGGHIGYGVNLAHRGRYFAAKACLLTRPVFQAHNMDVIWITCNPDNIPSRKTCEKVGCTFIEIVDLPSHLAMYKEGERQKCRYRWILYP